MWKCWDDITRDGELGWTAIVMVVTVMSTTTQVRIYDLASGYEIRRLTWKLDDWDGIRYEMS